MLVLIYSAFCSLFPTFFSTSFITDYRLVLLLPVLFLIGKLYFFINSRFRLYVWGL